MIEVPVEKLAILVNAGIFIAKASKIIIDVDNDGNIMNVRIEKVTYRRGKT